MRKTPFKVKVFLQQMKEKLVVGMSHPGLDHPTDRVMA